MTNTTFIFETSPNTKSKEKKGGGTWHILFLASEKVGGTRPTCLPPNWNCAHDCDITDGPQKYPCLILPWLIFSFWEVATEPPMDLLISKLIRPYHLAWRRLNKAVCLSLHWCRSTTTSVTNRSPVCHANAGWEFVSHLAEFIYFFFAFFRLTCYLYQLVTLG